MSVSSNCNDVSVGLGTLYINGMGVGYLKNNVEYAYEYDVLKFYTGTPQVLTCQFVIKLNSSLKATYAQINAANLSRSLGQLAVNSQSTTAITVTSGSPQTFQPILDLATGNYWFRVSPINNEGGVLSSFTSVIVKDSSSTLVLNTDYTIDALGNVALLSGGSYVPGDPVTVSYGASLLAGMTINLGSTFALNEMDVMFIHNKINTGKRVAIWIPRCTVTGKIHIKFEETQVILNEIQIDALADSNYPSYPFGRMFLQS